jgi:hypothetical protein
MRGGIVLHVVSGSVTGSVFARYATPEDYR